VQLYDFLTSALDGDELSAPSTLPPERKPPHVPRLVYFVSLSTHCTENKKRVTPAKNQTPIPLSSSPSPSHYTDLAVPAPKNVSLSKL
jgi:hypothetical protein